MIREGFASPPAFCLYAAALFAIVLVGFLAMGPHSKPERNFRDYLGQCERAGYTAAQCLFADHYPEQARTLGGIQ